MATCTLGILPGVACSDGSRLVVAATRPDLRADSYVGQLWELTLEGGRRRLTRGFRDTAPQYSRDGELLVFLRAAPGGTGNALHSRGPPSPPG